VRVSLRISPAFAAVFLLLSWDVSARPPHQTDRYADPVSSRAPVASFSLDSGKDVRSLAPSAAPDTTILGYWDFDNAGACDQQGWTVHDLTSKPVFFRVDDFAGLGGGDFGRLVALEGNQSMWCGLRPNPVDPDICSYATLPGYGNNWDQRLTTAGCLSVTGDVSIDFLLSWDCEEGYDRVFVEYDQCDDNWVRLDPPSPYYLWFDSNGSDFISYSIPDSLHSGSARVRVRFTSDGAFSDEEGLLNTDGAFLIDSLRVSDAGGTVLSTELFETEAVGDQQVASGNWVASSAEPYGTYAALQSGLGLFDQDPCVSDATCLWTFFSGSTADFSCGGFPGVTTVPYGTSDGKYLNNEIWSPWATNAGAGSTYELTFRVYRDLPFDALVFFVWHVRSIGPGGCATAWRDNEVVYEGRFKAWDEPLYDLSTHVDPGATSIQIALGVVDFCPIWCGVFGSGNCHTNAPFFDDVLLRRIDSNGPRWSVRDFHLFQDNFAGDGTTTGTVRADMSLDVARYSDTVTDPGDSVAVTVYDPEAGIAGDPHTGTGPAVYAWVGVWPAGQPGKSGAALSSDPSRWPVVDSTSTGGNTWYCVRMDSVWSFGSTVEDRYCVDLNDNLFTPGDTICYVFSSDGGGGTTYYSNLTGTTDDASFAFDNAMEFTCLPTAGFEGGRRILYVDNFDALGAQPFFDTAFDVLGIHSLVDRYDIHEPGRGAENTLASRVVDPTQQLVSSYHTIIWNSGDVGVRTLEGNDSNEKNDDYGLLYEFLDNLPVPGGVYLSGDNLAYEWYNKSSPSAYQLRDFLDFQVASGDHIDYGLATSPLVIGASGGCFDHFPGPDTLIAYGGCPGINDFDVLTVTSPAAVEASYDGNPAYGAVVGQKTNNSVGADVGVMLSGFSFHEIRDVEANGIPARVEHLKDILLWLGGTTPTATGATVPGGNSMSQNYPNPFNPTTAIEFTVKERARVALRVYNVAGQLVATLVDGVRAPGVTHRAEWDGLNRSGNSVASGVYFYRLQTPGVSITRKMVLLK
jgi:hypothetical protein